MSPQEVSAALGFVHLTDAMEGSDTWIAAGAIWSIEKSPLETSTAVKTPEGVVMVIEPPETVFERLFEVMMGPQPPTGVDGSDVPRA